MKAGVLHAEISSLLEKIGRAVATLHDGGLIHGDLTTSNMLIRNSDSAVVSQSLLPADLHWCD